MYILAKIGKFATGTEYTCAGLSFDGMFPGIISVLVTWLKIGIPILLIIFGMLDLGKAVMAQKDDEIKKGQQTLVKRFITAVIVFFVFTLVQLVVGLLGGGDSDNIKTCLQCFINGEITTVQSDDENQKIKGCSTYNNLNV